MSGRLVIACYRPKPGQEAALEALTATHVPRLRALGLATDREAVVMRASDGTIVEVFEWASAQAIADAHSHPAVLELWGEYAAVCEMLPVGQLSEAAQLFSEFTPL